MKTSNEKIEAVRGILTALDKSITEDGIFLTRVLFKRNERGFLTDVLLTYEEQTDEEPETDGEGEE